MKPNTDHPPILYSKEYQSLSQMIDDVTFGESPLVDNLRSSRKKGSPEWYGTDSFETAQHLATFGWEEGFRKIKQIVPIVKEKFDLLIPKQDYGEETAHDVSGGAVDIGQFLGGNPACMTTFRPNFEEIKQGDILQRIYINGGYHAGIEAQTVFNRAACLIAMVDSLEVFGFRMEINVIDVSYANNAICYIMTTIKGFDEHTDMDKLAFSVGNASFLRRMIFSAFELAPQKIIEQFGFSESGGYGKPYNYYPAKDPVKDVYIDLPTDNMDLDKAMEETVKLVNGRFKGLITGVDNSHIKEDEGGMGK
jgi:hypothetical protein